MKIRRTFLYILYQQNKVLFTLVISFVLGQLFFSYKGVETMPFFNYGMYSSPCASPKVYNKTIVLTGAIPINLYEINNRSATFLNYQLHYHRKLSQQNYIDYTQNTIDNRFGKATIFSSFLHKRLCNDFESSQRFLPWLSTYISKDKLQLGKKQYIFSAAKFQAID